jgi:hypothetical protein
MSGKYVLYKHHGVPVIVKDNLKGKHREYCLCYSCCWFKPDTEDNCVLAEDVYALNVKHNLVTPVWECPLFQIIA